MTETRRIMVIGGCGFIGSHLVEHLANKGDDVLVLDNLSSGNLRNVRGFREKPQIIQGVRDTLG